MPESDALESLRSPAASAEANARRRAKGDKYIVILDAALACFVERGFYGTAVPEVAKRAGVAAGTIYNYFPSKEALVNAVFRHHKQALAQRVLMTFPAMAPPREQYDAMWREMTAFALSNPDAFAFLEFHQHRSYLDDESRALENQLKEFAANAVGIAQAQGVFKPLPVMLLMELMFGAFIGMMRAHLEGRVTLDDDALAGARDACWDLIATSMAVPSRVVVTSEKQR